jgi:CRISPR-associated protein Cmr4
MISNYLTYLYLLTPLHTGGSANEGNVMGIAREVHTEFPYLPSSSLRGKIRSELEQREPQTGKPDLRSTASLFFGQKINNGQQPTEGEVWFADATLLFFPIASLSHHLVWITCPLWLERWSRWLAADTTEIQHLIQKCRSYLHGSEQPKSAVTSFSAEKLYLQTALLKSSDLVYENFKPLQNQLQSITEGNGLLDYLFSKLIVLTDEDCAALVETGLQREVRVALEEESKTVKGGSFRSEEAIPPEAVLFFPWGTKLARAIAVDPKEQDPEKLKQAQAAAHKKAQEDDPIRQELRTLLDNRLQFGGLEGLGRGWADLKTVALIQGGKS